MAQAVELHIVSDSTGETAARLVQALEAQFPEQEFEEVRHARAETVEDLERAVRSARGHAAVLIYTLVDPELRDTMRRVYTLFPFLTFVRSGQLDVAVALFSGLA